MAATAAAEGSRAARWGEGRPPAAPGGSEESGAERRGGAMGEPVSSDESDETVVESSFTESDVEEKEFCWRRWLSFLNEDIALSTEMRINEGAPSPEIGFIQKFCGHDYSKKVKQINPIPQDTYASDQSQSLLQGWIKRPSLTEDISKPDFSLNAAVEGEQNDSVDIKLNGFQKDSEKEKLSNEDLSPEISLSLDALLEDTIAVPKEQTPQNVFLHVLEDCQRTCMTIIDRDDGVKEHSPDNDTDLSLMSPGKIIMEAFTEQSTETGEFEISDLLRFHNDNFQIINPLPDILECQGHAFSIDPSADESSDAPPVQLGTALNALSSSAVQPVACVVPNERQLNIEGKQLNSEAGIPQLYDDCTQITNMIEPQLATIQTEEIKALTGSNLQRTTNEQPVGDQQREKEVISDYWGATSSEKQTGEGSSYSVEAAACAETAQTTLRKAMQLESPSRKCRGYVSSHHQKLEETQQRMSHSDRQDAFVRNFLNGVCPISLSTINKRNIYGETVLHRAVVHEDVDFVRNIIKAGVNVNVQDYAGWTALHEASVKGFYEIANELLKAGANVNARGNEQITPLQDAVKGGHYEMAALLLRYGADPLLKNEMGRCALEEASDLSMRKLLKSYLAKSGRDSVTGCPIKGTLDEAFLLQLQETSHSQALVVLGDFSHPGICWRSSMVSCMQSRRLLECTEDNFLTQVLDSPSRGVAILDLVVTNTSELIGDIKIGGSLGCSDHALVEFTVLEDCGSGEEEGGGDSKNMLNTQSGKDTNLHQISLQTVESESACANLANSDSTDILQQTIVNEVQNIYTNVSEDGTSCTEQTLQANAETPVACELLAATNGEGVSGSPYNSTSCVLSSIEQKAPQPEKGGRILFSAAENVEGCHIETENAGSLDITPIALQLHEKDTLQIRQKREDLQETNSKAGLHFGVNADIKSYSFQSVENTQKETSEKADEGVFAGVSGTEDTEKNEEERNSKTNVLSQFTETEVIQTKRIRLHPQETSQKAALYSSSSKTRFSSSCSQFSRAAEQQTSQKSESFLSTRKEGVILSGACNTTAVRKMKKKNAKGETQLHIAARKGNLSLVKTLISYGICVNEQDHAGWTPIHEASAGGFTDVILELLKAGADVNSRSLDGILPIHDAVSGNYLEAVKILLQHGANPCERDGSGKSALDEACDDEMKELLKSYSAMDSLLSFETIEVTERRYPSRSRSSKRFCNYCEKDGAALEPQYEKYNAEFVAAIQDAEEKQKELLVLELRTSKDTDIYIQRLSQIQDTLNEMLAKQKTERDTLAKKYRASVESLKKGALRKQLVNLACRQKSLLTVTQNQEELVQKIRNYRKTKRVLRASCSEKQISNLVFFHGNNKRPTADEIMCPDVVRSSMGLGTSMSNENRVEAHRSLENRFSSQECSQHPYICLDERGANQVAIGRKEASDQALAYENRVRECLSNNTSKLTSVEVVMLPSEPTVSIDKTKCSQQKDIDCVGTAVQGSKSLNPTSVTNMLNIVEPQSTVVNNNVCQPGSHCQQVLTDEDLRRYANRKEPFQWQQQQQVFLSTSTKNFPNTLQQMIFRSSENSFNANSVLTNLTSNTDYPVNLSEKSSQSYSSQEFEQKQVRRGRKARKNLQWENLLELGRIKPGEDVLEFRLQEFSYKATILKNGKIRTSRRQTLQNRQWVNDLLGRDISVTYVLNKVTYLGTQLSKFVEEVSVSSDLELPSQEREPLGSSVQFNSVESLTCFLQFSEILLVRKEEFLPCSVMEKHWSFYKGCEDFGF
ncbi:LOW QUALITY PROTEIN: ankyrin repeat domain-containing protein 31 [Pterocles gutturalis]